MVSTGVSFQRASRPSSPVTMICAAVVAGQIQVRGRAVKIIDGVAGRRVIQLVIRRRHEADGRAHRAFMRHDARRRRRQIGVRHQRCAGSGRWTVGIQAGSWRGFAGVSRDNRLRFGTVGGAGCAAARRWSSAASAAVSVRRRRIGCDGAGRFLFQIHGGHEGEGVGRRFNLASSCLCVAISLTGVPFSITPSTL